jgi:hypothetical protein
LLREIAGRRFSEMECIEGQKVAQWAYMPSSGEKQHKTIFKIARGRHRRVMRACAQRFLAIPAGKAAAASAGILGEPRPFASAVGMPIRGIIFSARL